MQIRTANPNRNTKALAACSRKRAIAFTPPDGISLGKLQEKPVFYLRVFLIHKRSRFGLNRKRNMYVISELDRWRVIQGLEVLVDNLRKILLHWNRNLRANEPMERLPLEHLWYQQTSPYYRAPHIYVAIGGSVYGRAGQVAWRQTAEELGNV